MPALASCLPSNVCCDRPLANNRSNSKRTRGRGCGCGGRTRLSNEHIVDRERDSWQTIEKRHVECMASQACILNLRRRSTTRLQDVAKRCQKRASLKIGCLVFPLHRKSARRMENPSPKLLMLQEQWDLRVRRNSDDANGICQTCYSTMSILPSPSVCTTRKAFRAKWAASFSRAANSRARRSSRSTDVSSSFCRLSVTRRKMAGVSPVCLFVVLGHDVDFEKRCV